MNQEQEKFQKSLREFLTSARESGQQITAEQAEAFFEEQNLNEEQRAMVREYLEMEQIDIVGAEKKERKIPEYQAKRTGWQHRVSASPPKIQISPRHSHIEVLTDS